MNRLINDRESCSTQPIDSCVGSAERNRPSTVKRCPEAVNFDIRADCRRIDVDVAAVDDRVLELKISVVCNVDRSSVVERCGGSSSKVKVLIGADVDDSIRSHGK